MASVEDRVLNTSFFNTPWVGDKFNHEHSPPLALITSNHLGKFASLGEYDRGATLAHIRREKNEDSVKRFVKILDWFEHAHDLASNFLAKSKDAKR